MEERGYLARAAKLICASYVVVGIYLALKYAQGVLLPFIFGAAIGVPIYFLSRRLCGGGRAPKKLCAAVLLILAVGLVGFGVFKGAARLFFEVQSFISSGALAKYLEELVAFLRGVISKIPFALQLEQIEGFEGFGESAKEQIISFAEKLFVSLGGYIPELIMGLVESAPKLFLSVFVSLLSAFYFATDYDRIKRGILSVLSEDARGNVSRIGSALARSMKKYAKAYLLIMLITFCEVFVGLLLLGQSYAYLLAVIIAIVDILPVLGAGTVLVPWGIIALFQRDYKLGLGLLLLFLAVSVIREIIEPKLVGDSLGIHPLASLFATFAGLSLFGVFGMLVSPFVFLLVKEFFARENN